MEHKDTKFSALGIRNLCVFVFSNLLRVHSLLKKPQKNGQTAKISIYKCISTCYVWLFLGYLLAILAIWLFENSNSQEIAKPILLFVSFL